MDDDSKYNACIEAASKIAIQEVTEGNDHGIDTETRDAARSFLREEFEAWRTAPSQPESDA